MGCNKLPEILSELTNGYANAHRLNQAVGSCHFGSVCGVMLSLNVLGTYAGVVTLTGIGCNEAMSAA